MISNGIEIIGHLSPNIILFVGVGNDTLTGGTGQDTISDFTVSDQDILEFYYRSGNTSDINDLSLTDGVLSWATGGEERAVQIDLSGTLTSVNINDYSDLISSQ
jgi:hypothetical protein